MATYQYANGRQGSTPSYSGSSNKNKNYNASTDFDTIYASNIAGLAKANNVDTNTAATYLRSNLAGTTQYKGGGVLDYGQANRDLAASNSERQRAREYENYSTSNGGYNSANDYYTNVLADQEYTLKQAQKAQEDAIRQRTQAAVDANNAYIPQVNAQTDKQLQAEYIRNELAKSNLPQQMSAMGFTGGLTESSLTGLNANYGNARNNLETSRNTSLDQIRQNAQRIQATGNADLASAASDYYNNLVNAQQQAAQQAQEQSNWQAQFDAQQQANAKSDYANTAAAYYNDYQAQINKLKAQGYTDDDYEVKVLNQLRNQKITDLQTAQSAAEQQAFENYIKQQNLANNTAKTNYTINKSSSKSSKKSSSKASTKKYTPSQIQTMYKDGWIDEATAKRMLGV